MDRRTFVKSTTIFSAATFTSVLKSTANTETPTFILRSGWQPINIGDITHSPGVLQIIKTYIPNAKLVFWPVDSTPEANAMIQRHLPDLKIIESGTKDGLPTDPELLALYDQADVMIHGSGAGVYQQSVLRAWHQKTNKPYGFFGVTVSYTNENIKDYLQNAAFVFCRETHSVENVKSAGIDQPIVGFAPDGTFAIELANEDKAQEFLKSKNLIDKEFICAIPRLRYTPYHKLKEVNWSEEKIKEVETVNAKYKEQDHAKLRYVIQEWVRQTGKKVLVCPEMTYQLDIIDPLVVDPLPDDVKQNVEVRDTFWLPDEAASVYKRAHTIISMECHSPIIAAKQGTPCFYVRQPEDTIKGQMYYDIGLNDWVFEIDETEGQDILDQLIKIENDYQSAQQYLAQAINEVQQLHKDSMTQIRQIVSI